MHKTRHSNGSAWRRGAAVAATGVAALALLTSCAAEVDPQLARDTIAQVTEEPLPPSAAEELDAELHPEPTVEPLECSEYLIITARGTGEPETGQLVSPVARKIAKALPKDTQTVDLDYPADTDVQEGGTRGVRWLIDTLNVQAEACPKQHTVLLGYSQGALVAGDALAQPEQRMVGATVGMVSEEAAEQVAAVVFYGDPRFVGSAPYNTGTFSPELNGILPRPEGSLERYEDLVQDFCVAGDFVCQSSLSGVDELPHTEYYSNGMQKEGAEWVIDLIDHPQPKR